MFLLPASSKQSYEYRSMVIRLTSLNGKSTLRQHFSFFLSDVVFSVLIVLDSVAETVILDVVIIVGFHTQR